uniref:Uncharacterized protein n=1 Tax=Varanus komodoensis TaxID=61221 RepID=A0A8D2L3G8_VARKO
MPVGDTCPIMGTKACSVEPGSGSSTWPRAYPDIDPSWYTGRGIRPVGRFGRRRAAAGEGVQKLAYRQQRVCLPIEESNGSLQDE